MFNEGIFKPVGLTSVTSSISHQFKGVIKFWTGESGDQDRSYSDEL